jgi:hypothetical protein
VPHTHRRKTRVVLVLAVVAAAAAAAAAAAFFVGPRLSDDATTDGTTTGTASVTPAQGATETSSSPYTIKPEPSEVATDTPLQTTSGRVDVVLTYAGFEQSTGTVQANGFVAGVLEDGGTCTLTLTKGDDEVTATSTAAADATTTSCGLLETPAGLDAGTWDAVLAYSSTDAEGTSAALEVVVR